MDLFYDPEFDPDNGVLNEVESHHCLRVKRNRFGDEIGITNGKGQIYFGKISQESTIQVVLTNVTSKTSSPPSPMVHLAVSILKNQDRYEWMIEKATELGVYKITPLVSQFCERKKVNESRLEKKSISAIKQSHNPYLPIIAPPALYKDFIQAHSEKKGLFMAHPGNVETPSSNPINEITVLIGPEGGFSLDEVALAAKNHCEFISLGNNILRTETAAIVAATKFLV